MKKGSPKNIELPFRPSSGEFHALLQDEVTTFDLYIQNSFVTSHFF
jgi:hypothetical protein